MLQEIAVKNFGLIEEMQISFNNGLHVLTGETGAGKSMLIDALAVVVGGRASQELIRHGCDSSYIEALFIVPEDLNDWFVSNGIDITEDQQLIINREIKAQGKSTCRINGRLMPVQLLKEIMEPLVDIHGQHEHQKLLNIKEHIKMLDGYGKFSVDQQLAEIKEIYNRYHALNNRYKQLITNQRSDIQRIEFLEYQLSELKLADLQVEEEQELEAKKQRLVNIDKLTRNISQINISLMEGSTEVGNAYNLINNAISCLHDLNKIDSNYAKYIDMLENANIHVAEVAREVSASIDLDIDEEDINVVESRLYQLQQLKRKYRLNIQELVEYQNNIENELYQLQNRDSILNEIEQDLAKVKATYDMKAAELTKTRKTIAGKMEQQLKDELSQLSLPNVQFKIQFDYSDEPRINGVDEVEFLFSANLGEPLKPIVKIASGGELSRIMLALKNILAKVDQTPTVIFDEVDTGVSGIAAQRIAEKLACISNDRQVFCITHLPQIAAMSDVHLHIHKQSTDNKTITNINILNDSQIIDELSRMISGQKITEKTRETAKEIRETAIKYKNNITR